MTNPPGRRNSSRTYRYNHAVPLGDPQPGASVRRGKARERIRRRQERLETGKRFPSLSDLRITWTWGILALAMVGIVVVISLIGLMANGASSGPKPTVTRAAALNASLTPTPPISIRAWDGNQRFTILIMGMDRRPGDENSGSSTDTIILVSIDPATKSIGMLSIPRDLYVPIPGQSDMQRINSAYILGELQQPGSGPKLVMQTIQYNFGIPVNSYVLLSFDAVIGLVDAIGGIDINVPKAIDDPEYPDMNYGFDPLYIPAGQTHMDGNLALKYARTRHQDTDFDRTSRQQQVIMAIRQKALKPDVLPQLVANAPGLWDRLSKGLVTDFTLDRALSLGWYMKDVPLASIKRGTVQDKYVLATQYQGNTILTPNRSILAELMTQVFGPNYSH